MVLLVTAGLALSVAGCRPGGGRWDEAPITHRLTERLPAAAVHREVGGLDLGSPEAEAYLRTGWSYPERKGELTYLWSEGAASSLELFLTVPRQLRLELTVRPYPLPGAQRQGMTVTVGEREVATLELEPGFVTYEVPLPAAALRAGANRLVFRYRATAVPAERGDSRDRRRLAVAWDRLRLRPVPPSGADGPAVVDGGGEAAAGVLRLPFGTQVDFHERLHGPAALVLDGIEADGSGQLEVVVQAAGEPPEVVRLAAGAERHAVELPGGGRRLVRLGLRAVAADGAVPGALELHAPTIRGGAPAQRRAGRGDREAAGPRPPRPPNLLVYLVDTLRAAGRGGWGGAPPLTPELDAFAAGATLYERALAQSPWTRPSVSSILTGLEPPAHGVTTLDDALAPEAVTLAEHLGRAGYRTAAFSTNWHVSPAAGLDQGFDDFLFFPRDPRSDAVNRRVFGWLDAHAAESPWFLYVHALDPHAPYEPRQPFRERFAGAVTRPGAGSKADIEEVYASRGREREHRVAELALLYDGEVAANDASFGALLDELERRGLYDGTVIVFVSDHGEEFDEHGFLGHANNLHGETLNVPLVIKGQGQRRGRRVSRPVQHVDLLPTLLATLGLGVPPGLPGADLRSLAATPAPRAIFSHLTYERRRAVSVVEGRWKLIMPLHRRAVPLLYDLEADPEERDSVAAVHPVRRGYLEARLRAWQAGTRRTLAAEAAMDAETRRGLEALGYL